MDLQNRPETLYLKQTCEIFMTEKSALAKDSEYTYTKESHLIKN